MQGVHAKSSRWTSRRPTRCARRRTRRCASPINLVKDGTAQACVSAGNTGALMAIARFVLKTLPGIDRPAIASQLPTRKGVTTALDLGANVNCTPEQLVQFAVMGSALATAVDGIERPTVGLLNIGEEDIKGNDVVKQTAELLKASPLNFYGNIEGNDIYKGTTDVVVCDGFVGNVALKVSEGLVVMLYDFLRTEFTRNPVRKLAALAAYPGADGVQEARRSAPLQRRHAGRPEGRRREEPRQRRRPRLPPRAVQGARRSRARRARQDRARGRGDAGVRTDATPAPRRDRRDPMQASRIAGTGRYLPADVLTNDELAQRVATSDEWIRTRTGIRQRHIAARGRADVRPGAARVARGDRRGRHDAADIDLIIVATATPDMIFPSTACILQDKLGVQRRRGVRRRRRVLGLRLRAGDGRQDGRAAAPRATRWSSAPRSIRASSTGTTAAPACCSATARARSSSCRRPRRAS